METDDARVTALIEDLDHFDKPVIRNAVDSLIALAGQSSDVRPALHRRLEEAGHRNYWPAAYILASLSESSPSVIQALLQALNHPEPDIRWAVSLLLAKVAETSPEVIGRLIGLCASGADNQKRMALYCLRDLALTDRASAAAMLGALADNEPSVRVAAAICLKTRLDLDPEAKQSLLKVYLSDEELKVRHAAAIALANLSDPSQEFLSALERNSRCGDDQVKKAANAALELLEKRRPASSGA